MLMRSVNLIRQICDRSRQLSCQVFVATLFIACSCSARAEDLSIPATVDAVSFTGVDNIEQLIEREIKTADRINVVIFLFEWKPIADFLIEAKRAGKEVLVYTDPRSAERPMVDSEKVYDKNAVTYLRENGVDVILYDNTDDSIMHHKFVLLDSDKTLLGSYNFQKKAQEKNAENLLLVRSEGLNKVLTKELQRLIKNKTLHSSGEPELRRNGRRKVIKYGLAGASLLLNVVLGIVVFLRVGANGRKI